MSNLKLWSWNVNGWRAVVRKGDWEKAMAEIEADVWCLQEIKAENPELPLKTASEYEMIYSAAEKKGYSGTMILAKKDLWLTGEKLELWNGEQKKVASWVDEAGGSNNEKDDQDWQLLLAEGRLCALAWLEKKMLLLNVYFPNGGMSEMRLKYKMDYYAAFLRQTSKLQKKWPHLIVCGDVNTAHQEIDLARPKENSKVTGFLPQERAWVTEFLAAGWIDTFRWFYPEKKAAYSWWDYKTRARERNVGWRIDYFLATKNLETKIKTVQINDQIMGSDHAPIELEIEI